MEELIQDKMFTYKWKDKNGNVRKQTFNDCKYYYGSNGKRHREDGPAIEYNNGDREYYLDGIKYSEEEYEKAIKLKLFW